VGRRLPPGEAARRAEARRRASWDRIKAGTAHYDPTDEHGYGSREQWRKAASGDGWTAHEFVEPPPKIELDLTMLGLLAEPKTLAELRAAYRAVARKCHPDTGGSHLAFISLKQAYDRLADRI
jgi:hypothetical protein